MIVIPAIDLRAGRCVRLRQGVKTDVTNYDDDPIEVASRFEAAGAEMLHVVDLDGAFGEPDSPNRSVAKRIVESINVPVEFGGGIRTIADVQQVVDLGVAHVILGTMAVESPETLRECVARFSSKICVGIDARAGRVRSRGWESETPLLAIDLARLVASCEVERIIYTDIARDGMLVGPNIEQTLALARAAKVRVTISGGVSSLDDIKRLRDLEEPLLDSVIVGKALYEEEFKLEEAIAVAS